MALCLYGFGGGGVLVDDPEKQCGLCWDILNKYMREHRTYVNIINFTEGKAEVNQLERLRLHGLFCWSFVLQLFFL